MTSITAEELCCLLIVAKAVQAKKVLEIGTWDGNTSVNFAANIDGNVVTVDLPPDFDGDQHKAALTYPNADLYVTDRAQLGRQFHGHSLGPRIHQVYGDSAKIDWSTLGSPFDLIFIDGCHDFEYVASDTANARKHIAPGGAVVWHDYGMLWDVSRVVDLTAHSANELKVHAIEGTRLAVGFRVSETNTTISSHLASTQL
jgi:hypothetical protein